MNSATVFEQYQERIHRYLLRLTRDPVEAEDLTQETFLRAHRQLESVKDPAALGVWLYRIATHLSYDRFRQLSSRGSPRPLDPAPDHETADAQWADVDVPRLDHAVEQAEMSACVQAFLEELPNDYRAVISLHDLHGLTGPEIARMLGCSLGAVKIRLHRARQKLKAALEAGCDFSCDERGVFVCERKSPNH